MKLYRHIIILMISILIISCSGSSPQWWTTEEGAKVWIAAKPNMKLNWNGLISKEGYANGYGTLSDKDGGKFVMPNRVFTGNMVKGKFEGTVNLKRLDWGAGGSYVYHYKDGVGVEQVPQSSAVASNSGSGLDSNTLLGGFLAIAGASQGDSFITNSGIALAQDDFAGLMRARQQANGTTGITNQTNSSTPRKKTVIANKQNLIDKYGLRVKYQNHVQYSSHVKAADANYRMYKKTGEERYYKAHESSADILNRWRDIDKGKY